MFIGRHVLPFRQGKKGKGTCVEGSGEQENGSTIIPGRGDSCGLPGDKKRGEKRGATSQVAGLKSG